MAKLTRVFQKIFGSTANASDIGVIGSLHEGTPTEATTIESIQSLPAFENGLRSIVIGENSPILEEDNGFYKLVTYQIAYLLQKGIPEWSVLTSYYVGDIVRVGDGTRDHDDPNVRNGYYKCISDNVGYEPRYEFPFVNWEPVWLTATDMIKGAFPKNKTRSESTWSELKNTGSTVGEVLNLDPLGPFDSYSSKIITFRYTDLTPIPAKIYVHTTSETTSFAEISIYKNKGGVDQVIARIPVGTSPKGDGSNAITGKSLEPTSLSIVDPGGDFDNDSVTYRIEGAVIKGSDANAQLRFINTAIQVSVL